MKKYILFPLIVLGISSCINEPRSVERKTEPLYLRQLVKSNKKETSSSGSFFLVVGSYGSESREEAVVQTMAKVDGEYRFLEMGIKKIRVRIDSNCKTPYIIINYKDSEEVSVSTLIENSVWYNASYTIVCSEELLPEKLLPIAL